MAAGEGVALWITNGPPFSIPPLKGEGGVSTSVFANAEIYS